MSDRARGDLGRERASGLVVDVVGRHLAAEALAERLGATERLRDAPRRCAALDPIRGRELAVDVARDHDRIDARVDGPPDDALRRVDADAGHIERVGDAQAGEAHPLPQKIGEDRLGDRRRHVGVERRIAHVRGHDHRRARDEGRAERHEVAALERLAIRSDVDELRMAVLPRVAVTGEVLRARRDARALGPADPRGRELGDALRLVPE